MSRMRDYKTAKMHYILKLIIKCKIFLYIMYNNFINRK